MLPDTLPAEVVEEIEDTLDGAYAVLVGGDIASHTWCRPYWLTSDGQRVTVALFTLEELPDSWLFVESEHRLRLDRIVPISET